MRFAVIKDNLVTNLIVAAEGQQAELETALGARLEKTKYQALSDELEGLKDDLSAAYTEGVNSIDAI